MFDTAVCVINCAIHKIIPGPEIDIINQSPSLTYLAYWGELGNLLLLPFLKQDNNRLFFEFLCALEVADYLCIKYLVINQDSILFLWHKSYKGVKAIRIGFPLVYYAGKVTRLSSDITVAYKRCIEWTSAVELRKTNWRSIEQVEMTSLNVIIYLPNIYLLWLITQMSETCHLKPCIGHLMHFLICSLKWTEHP